MLEDRIRNVTLRGGKLPVDVAQACYTATMDLTSDAVSQAQLEFLDPDLTISRNGLFQLGAFADVDGAKLAIAGIEIGQGPSGVPRVQVTFRSRGVMSLQARRGVLIMTLASATDFIKAESAAVGLKVVAKPTASRAQVARDIPLPTDTADTTQASSWTTFTRLAQEEGFEVFEVNGTVFFGPPTYLANNTGTPVRVDWEQPAQGQAGWSADQETYKALGVPTVYTTTDARKKTTVSVSVPWFRRNEFNPGKRLDLRGMPGLPKGVLMITENSYPLTDEGACAISAMTPIDPVLDQIPGIAGGDIADIAPPAGGKTGGATSVTTLPDGTIIVTGVNNPNLPIGTKLASDFVGWSLTCQGDSYIYGATVDLSDLNPQAEDCSLLVQWSLTRVGISYPRFSGNQFTQGTPITVAQAKQIRGALLFISTNVEPFPNGNQHVGISLGDGRTMEARDTAEGVHVFTSDPGWDCAALVPGLIYTASDVGISQQKPTPARLN